MDEFSPSFALRYVGKMALVFCAYLVTAKIGLSFYAVSGFATLVWPPSAIALAAMYFWGYEMWSAVFLGACTVNFLTGASLPVAIGIGVGNTLEPLAGTYILREIVGLNPMLQRMRDSLGMMLTALTVTMISATIGVGSLFLGETVKASAIPQTWLAWWVGDTLALLVLAPFLIRWIEKPFFTRTLGQLFEGVSAFGLLVLTNWFAFFGPFDQLHGLPLIFIFIPLSWISLRMGPRGLTLANVIIALSALSGTLSHQGVFAQGNTLEDLFLSQLFVAIISIVFFIFTSSVEERKEVEIALQSHVGALEGAVEKISSEDQAKTDFLAILAHELRNPLSPIVSALELIKINGIEPQNAALFDTIEVQIHTIGRLLEDLLDISRISHKKFKLQKESIQLQKVLQRSLETVRPFLNDRGHKFSASIPQNPIWLNGDPIRLTQIFVNILYNAAKYTNPGGTITLTCREEPGLVRVAVADTGIGIEKQMFTRIFEPFVQASDSTVDVGTGLGIGLSLTKRLVGLHEGTITVASEGKGKGSVFTVTLPVLDVVQLAMATPPLRSRLGWRKKNAEPSKTFRVLIVDDNEAAANGMQKLLQHKGHEVETAYTGTTALQFAASNWPDAIILDIGLPDLDGYEVAKRLREEHDHSLILIALSGYGQKEDKDKAFDAGFNYHLTKPVSVDDVEALLQKSKRT